MTNINRVNEIFERFCADNPSPKTELDYTNAFTLLVAVVLSAQSTDKSVNKATKALFEVADTPHKMIILGYDTLVQYIKTIGLFQNKAKFIIKLSEILIKEHKGEVPDSRESLEKLPGVGRKTANVVLNIIFGHSTLAVDTHIFRLANRLGIATGETPLEVEQKLLQVIPPNFLYNAHHWLILHGRYICTARKPDCAGCRINDLCNSYLSNS